MVEYWQVEGELSAFRETLLPNGRVELMVNLGPPHRVLSPGGAGLWERAWVSGLQERALVIESAHGSHLVSARMHPLGAAALLGRRVARTANTVVDLEMFLGPEGLALADRVRAARTPAARFELLEDFLRRSRQSGDPAPDFVCAAASLIERAHGGLHVSQLHQDLGVSRKHLAVSFSRHLGISTKAYAKIRRFIWTLERLRESEAPDWSRLAGEAGYSDQSHLVRDFRRIGAASPTDYLRRWTPDGASLLADG